MKKIYPEQLVLFADIEDTAVSERKGYRSKKHTSRRPSSRKGEVRTSSRLHNPFDSFDANRYHTVGADVEANDDIGYGRERHSGTCSDNRHIMRYRSRMNATPQVGNSRIIFWGRCLLRKNASPMELKPAELIGICKNARTRELIRTAKTNPLAVNRKKRFNTLGVW